MYIKHCALGVVCINSCSDV